VIFQLIFCACCAVKQYAAYLLHAVITVACCRLNIRVTGHQRNSAAFYFSHMPTTCRTWAAWNSQVSIIRWNINV